ncbi:MAG TPA: energy transducer TonB [Kofleriaceae bacterium]|nr:energy transducer TonB [Kofleriaceae bacterium]
MSARATRSLSVPAAVAIAVVSVVVHAAALWLIQIGGSSDGEPTAPVVRPPPLVSSCPFDALLASSAHALACATPLADDPWACLSKEPDELSLSLILCRGKKQPAADMTVALLDPHKLDIKPVPLAQVAPAMAAQIEKEQQQAQEQKREQAQRAEVRPKPAGQVVEVVKPELEIRPDQARYVAEYDSKVEHETVARGSTEKMVKRPGPKDVPAAREAKNSDARPDDAKPGERLQPRDRGNPDADRGPGEGKRTLAMRDRPRRDLGQLFGLTSSAAGGALPRRGAGGRSSPAGDRAPANPGGGGGSLFPRTAPDLRPTKEMLARAVGGGSVDWVAGVNRGDTTALNAKRWKFAGFFDRLKRRVAQKWQPGAIYHQRDPTGRIHGTKNRLTVLTVALHPSGKIAKIFIAKPCGVDFLDDEAVRAFYAAQPFSHAPAGLVDPKSHLITFSFGFHFEVGHRSQWRIFRWDD